jgi:phosphoglycolate phosphatase-like HAD superfamily hydrolase
MAASGLHPIFEGVKLALFDKDGTLTHCDKCFGPYIEELMTKLAALGYVKDHARFMHALGYYPATKEFALDSIMVRGSNDGVRRAAAKEAFTQSQIDAVDADGAQNGTGETSGDRAYTNFEATFLQHTIEQAVWTVDLHKHLTTDTLELCTVRSAAPHGPSREEVEAGKIMFFGVFDALRANTIAVGIATSDDRHITEHTLRIIGLDLASSPGGVFPVAHTYRRFCGV